MIFDERDVRYEVFSGHGPGGQARNKTQVCVRAIHEPTGTIATSTSERSLRQNKASALDNLKSKLKAKVDGVRAKQKRDRHDQKPDAAYGYAIRVYRLCGRDQGVIDRRISGEFHINTLKRGQLDPLIKAILRPAQS